MGNFLILYIHVTGQSHDHIYQSQKGHAGHIRVRCSTRLLIFSIDTKNKMFALLIARWRCRATFHNIFCSFLASQSATG